MRRFTFVLLLIAMMPLNACAQWYLFPGKKKVIEKTVTEEPNTQIDSIKTETEDTISEISIEDVFYRPSHISLSLILPLKASSEKPNENFLEMYSGALLALQELSEDGLNYSLNVIDSEAGEYEIQDSDIIIGPVTYNEIVRLYGSQEFDNKLIISPLDPKVYDVVDQYNVVQSPVNNKYQLDDMIKWIDEEYELQDSLFVFEDKANFGQQAQYLLSELESRALPLNRVDSLAQIGFLPNRNYKFVILSDNDAFHTAYTRNIAIEAERYPKSSVILYSTSRIRSSISQNVADLHLANAHITAGYHIDYDNDAVKAFVLKYRSLYNSEPSSFAFQGYDAIKYYIKICSEYGPNWHKKLSVYPYRGLQSDFLFDEKEHNARSNTAVRRVVYNKDYSTTLL